MSKGASGHKVAFQAREAIRLDAWRSVFERTNRIVSAAPVRVVVEEVGPNHPYDGIAGWTDGEVIHFNGTMLTRMLKSSDTVSAVLRLKGLNYHELSHVLFTPRSNEQVVRNIRRRQEGGHPNTWYAFNALEDQRIETAFSAIYSPSRRYFEAMALKFLLEKGTAETAILLHGRKYLDAEVRVRAQAAFEAKYSPDLFRRFAEVIDNYLLVKFPQNSIMADQLVTQFAQLVSEMAGVSPQAAVPPLVHDDHKSDGGMTAGAPMRGADQNAAIRAVEAMKDAADKADEEQRKADAKAKAEADAEKDDADDAADSGAADEGGGEDSDDLGSGDDLDSDDQAPSDSNDGGQDNASDSGQNPVPGKGAGAGPSDPLRDAIRDMLDAVEKNLDEAKNDLQNDVDVMLDAVKAAERNGDYKGENKREDVSVTVPSTTDDVRSSRKVSSIIQQIRAVAEPEILRQQPNGRVDVRRAMTRKNTDVEIFTRYDEGALDDTGMEVVLLVDISTSMSSAIGDACRSMWALKRAFDKTGIGCTVMTYQYDYDIVWRSREKCGSEVPQIHVRGGTTPQGALQAAHRVLTKSREPNKVLITVTDGQWMIDPDAETSIMKSIHDLGAVTMLLGLDGAVGMYGKHQHMVGHDMTSVNDLPKATTKMVAEIMRRVVNIA